MDWSSITPAVVIALCSLITACCSMLIALHNFRRSNHAIIRVLHAQCSHVAQVGRGQYCQFRIVIQNLGIPLQNVGMSLGYNPEPGFGWATCPMKTEDGKAFREGQFAKGAITEFVFATDRFNRGDDDMIKLVTDLKSQHAELVLHADRYKMWFYRLHDRRWWLKRRWNRFAGWINQKMMREVKTPRGTNAIKYIFQLPVFTSAGRDFLRFAASVRNAPPQPQPPGSSSLR